MDPRPRRGFGRRLVVRPSPARQRERLVIRITLAFWIGLVCALGYGVFQVKYEVQEMESRIVQLNRGIVGDQQAIHVLRAEWSYLNQPSRLEALAFWSCSSASITSVRWQKPACPVSNSRGDTSRV